MTLRRAVIEAVDRPGGRALLGALATRAARRGTGQDVQVLYDRAWIHRFGSTYIPVSDRFEYRREWDSALATMLDPIPDNWFFVYRPREGDTIVDVGAGDGLDSLIFSRAVGATGRVLAIEAHPTTFALLEQTCRLNGLANVTALQYAAMDRAGTVTIAEEGSHRDFYSIVANGNGAVARKQVPGATLDELCRELPRIDLLKMNIEGAERYALPGAAGVLERTRHVCVACHDFVSERDTDLATKAFAVEFLRDHGFEVVLRDDHALPWVRDHVHAVRRPASPERR